MEVKTGSLHHDIYPSVSHASDTSMHSSIYDTYVAALQHDIADVPDHAVKIGVARRPTPWFYGQVDENVPELGPPDAVLDACKERAAELEEQGMDDADALNRAWEDTDFAERYREYLDQSDEAQAAIDELRDRMERGEDIVLVCYENTAEKRCHRTLLKAKLE